MISRGTRERTRQLLGVAATIAALLSFPATAAPPDRASRTSTLSPGAATDEAPEKQASGAFTLPIPGRAPEGTGLQEEVLAMARDLNSRAIQLQHQGRLAEAQALYEQCLTVLQRSFGPDHPFFAATLANLAALYQTKGRFSDAERLYAKALSVLRASLGPDHHIIAFNLNNLAMLYVSEKRYADAETVFKKSLVMLEEGLGPEHYATLANRYNLALLYGKLDRFVEAESLYKINQAILEQMSIPDNAALVRILARLEELYVKQGRHGEANALSARIRLLQACKQADNSGARGESCP